MDVMDQAFPGTEDNRTIQEVSDYIKAKNVVLSVEGPQA